MNNDLYLKYVAPQGLAPVSVVVRDFEPDMALPALDADGDQTYIVIPNSKQAIYQPEEIEDDEYNCVICIGGTWYLAQSIDFDFV